MEILVDQRFDILSIPQLRDLLLQIPEQNAISFRPWKAFGLAVDSVNQIKKHRIRCAFRRQESIPSCPCPQSPKNGQNYHYEDGETGTGDEVPNRLLIAAWRGFDYRFPDRAHYEVYEHEQGHQDAYDEEEGDWEGDPESGPF